MRNNNRKQLYIAITLSLCMGPAKAQFASEIELAEIGATGAGFVLNGVIDFDYTGRSVSAAGDVNGDGIDDLIIGANGADPNGTLSGASYVVFGKSTGFSSTFELSSLADGGGSEGFVLHGAALGDNSGFSVSAAGDVNGDGIDDLIIGALGADPNGFLSGASYVVFGKNTPMNGNFDSPFELSTLDGSDGFVLNGAAANDRAGISVSAAGDINGDGIDDLIIGADEADPNGQSDSGTSYVVFGKNTGFSSTFELSSLAMGDGSTGFVLNGEIENELSGYSVSAAGDVNGDGIDDLIIGSSQADPNGFATGASYVVFGRNTAVNGNFASSIELSSLDGSDGFVLNGVSPADRSGRSVSAAGDINSDGVDDLIIGAIGVRTNGTNSGASYVVFGRNTAVNGKFSSSIELSALDGSDGFVLNGAAQYDQSGISVSAAGDINGDGIDDLIIGASRADRNGHISGATYVVFGKNTAINGDFDSSIELSSLDGSDGYVLNGVSPADRSGRSVSAAGDINSDGVDDLIIGAIGVRTNGTNSGASYVVFGFRCEAGSHTYQVSTSAQLNYAIACANQSVGADTIELMADITLGIANFTDADGSTATTAINSEVTIDGQGHVLKRDENLDCQVDGVATDSEFRLLQVAASTGDLTLNNITLQNGCADGVGHAGSGGAVFNQGNLAITNSLINNNHAFSGGAISNAGIGSVISLISNNEFALNTADFAGALSSSDGASITSIENNTFIFNLATNDGGAINISDGANGKPSTVDLLANNTFFANSARRNGGALVVYESQIFSVNHNTFYSNEAESSGGAVWFFNVSNSNLNNSLFVVNSASDSSDNCLTNSGSFDNNMSDIGDGCGITTAIMTDLIDLNLQDNGCVTLLADGGCVKTHALIPGSAAIDAGINGLSTDQRGFGVNNIRDIGAFEFDGVNVDAIFEDGFE